MPLRIITLIFSLLFSQYAAADFKLFYEDNQMDYRNWGVGFDTQNLGSSHLFGWSTGISVNIPTVVDTDYLTSFGHLRGSLFPNGTIEPFASVAIDLLEFGVILLTDGDTAPQVDTQLSYGLRFNLGNSAIDVYRKETHLTGYTIVEGTYSAYGIAVVINY